MIAFLEENGYNINIDKYAEDLYMVVQLNSIPSPKPSEQQILVKEVYSHAFSSAVYPLCSQAFQMHQLAFSEFDLA